MEQNTKEWLEYRMQGLGASDIPVIMGNSPYRTAFELWQEKTGLVIPDENDKSNIFILNKGHELEVIARNRYEIETGVEWLPILCEHEKFPHFRASLDGFNKDKNAVWECKYIGKDFLEGVKNNIVPEKYKAQLHWQMFISGATENHLTVMDGEHNMATMIVKADIDYIKTLIKAASDFWNNVLLKVPPKLTEQDRIEIKDESVIDMLYLYHKHDFSMKMLKKDLEELKARIFKKLPHTNCFFDSGQTKFSIKKESRQGAVDNKKLFADKNITVEEQEKYRKKSSSTKVIRMTEKKEKK
jgi:putative phage-type endonuclease